MKSFSNETLFFSSESFSPPAFWDLPKLYELYKSCHRNPLETMESRSFKKWQTMSLRICYL